MDIRTNVGVIIVLIAIFGYISNWLNWRYINYKITHLLYYIGAFVHEGSHAIICLVTGAKIQEFKVFSLQPHIIHGRSRIPFLGELLISLAPIFGGLIFLYLLNQYILGDHFTVIDLGGQWSSLLLEPFRLLLQVRLYEWQSWVMLLLFINVGAMLGPSMQDIKNIWPALIILFFVQSSSISHFGLVALCLIVINIIIQIGIILCLEVYKHI